MQLPFKPESAGKGKMSRLVFLTPSLETGMYFTRYQWLELDLIRYLNTYMRSALGNKEKYFKTYCIFTHVSIVYRHQNGHYFKCKKSVKMILLKNCLI